MPKQLSQGLLFGWMSWSETPRAAADIMNDCVVKLRMWMMKNFERLWNLWITKVATVPKISPFVLRNKRGLKGLCLTKWFKNRIRKELRVISTGIIQQANCIPKKKELWMYSVEHIVNWITTVLFLLSLFQYCYHVSCVSNSQGLKAFQSGVWKRGATLSNFQGRTLHIWCDGQGESSQPCKPLPFLPALPSGTGSWLTPLLQWY